MSRLAALSASLEADIAHASDDARDLLAVLGTCVSRMLEREMRRHEVLAALFPEEKSDALPCVTMGRLTIQMLLEGGVTVEQLDHFLERLLRHAI